MIEKETDLELVEKVQNKQCTKSMESLINRHSELFYSVCNRTCSRRNLLTELQKDKDFVLYKAAKSFNPDKNVKFSTWLGNMTRYHCLNFLKKESKYIDAAEEAVTYFFSNAATELHGRMMLKTKIDHIFSLLQRLDDKRIEKIFRLRYLSPDKMTWKKIALKFDLTPQTIISLHTKGRRFLKKRLDSERV